MKVTAFSIGTLRSMVGVYRRFVVACCFYQAAGRNKPKDSHVLCPNVASHCSPIHTATLLC
jgi:hypothetical protein